MEKTISHICRGRALRAAIGITALALLLAGAGTAQSESGLLNDTGLLNSSQEMVPTDPFQISGRLVANGTHFELTNSSYLNITLDSSEPINLTLESVPEMVTMYIESRSGATVTQITLSGFVPQTTYHKYEDDYHDHIAFTTDSSGNYTYTQDISVPHLIFIQPRPSTKSINDNATGGDCTSFGTWDATTRTCTMTADLTETVQIDSNDITLDGNGHTITGSSTGTGIYLSARTGITLKNLKIKQFSYGIYLYSSNNNILANNNVSNNNNGISLGESWDNILTDNSALSNNQFGIVLQSSSGNNTLINNTADLNTYGIYLAYSSYGRGHTLKGNTMSGNNYNFGIDIAGLSTHNIDTSNTVDGKPIYYVSGAVNQIYDSSTNAGLFYCLGCNNVTIRDMDLRKNYYGVLFYYTSNSKTENIVASNNNVGIYLFDSSGNTVNNNNVILNGYSGISLQYGNSNIITNNNATLNYNGITVWSSKDNTLTSNIANLNKARGIFLSYYSDNTILTNNAASSNRVVGIELFMSKNNILTNNTNSNNGVGIGLSYSSDYNTLADNNASNNNVGYYLTETSSNNKIINNNISSNGGGIFLSYDASYNTMSNNMIINNSEGITTWISSNNELKDNVIMNSSYGIWAWAFSDNKLKRNTIMNNNYGIYLGGFSNNNIIYDNYFNNTDNFVNSLYSNPVNQWNTTKTEGINIISGTYLGGNYWANTSGTGFSQTCSDTDNDGICDSSYTLDSINTDYLPLTYRRDNIAPTTAFSLSGTLGSNGWYTSDVRINLTAADNEGGSGVKKIEYSFDNTTWNTYTVPFNISSEGTTTIYYHSTDNAGNVELTKSQTINIDKTPPIITINTLIPYGVYPIGTVLSFSASDSLSGIDTVYGNLTNTTGASQEVASGFTPTPGVYTLVVNASDKAGNIATGDTISFVVYDPDGGFIAGGGWIDSPAGAYVADPTLTGQANFGFVSKYQKGAAIPTGQTEFQFKVANLNFHSEDYEWLVVAGARAQYKGNGTVNGTGGYGFMLTAIDGAIQGGGADKFRIKIWDINNNGAIVYDNQIDEPESADPSTAIQGGSIVIHTDK